MGILSFFLEDKKSEIESQRRIIENAKLCIENEKSNMARYTSSTPKHYYEGTKQKIAHHRWVIATSRKKIASLKAK